MQKHCKQQTKAKNKPFLKNLLIFFKKPKPNINYFLTKCKESQSYTYISSIYKLLKLKNLHYPYLLYRFFCLFCQLKCFTKSLCQQYSCSVYIFKTIYYLLANSFNKAKALLQHSYVLVCKTTTSCSCNLKSYSQTSYTKRIQYSIANFRIFS